MSLADLFNSETDVTFEGQTYQLRQPTLIECGKYQRWLESEALSAAGRAAELPEDLQLKLLARVNQDIAAKVYRWDGEACVMSLRTPDGVAKLMSLIEPRLDYETALRLMRHRWNECVALVVGAQQDDPKEMAAILARLGLPPDFLSPGSSDSVTPPSGDPATSPPSADSPSAS